MTAFTILGVIWVALMGARLPTLRRECKLFVTSFVKGGGYTKTQARWVTFKYVFVPGLLSAPALVLLERSAFYEAPLAADIHDAAQQIDSVLKARAGITNAGE